MKRTIPAAAAMLFLAILVLWSGLARRTPPARAAGALAAAPSPKPVEDDLHEFMEYAFEPAFHRLKGAMAEAPAANDGWKAIKADSLALAEGGNLLLLRAPGEDPDAWGALAAAVREAGGKTYQAAKKKDFPAARAAYEAMVARCNACHDKFAGGEHRLAP